MVYVFGMRFWMLVPSPWVYWLLTGYVWRIWQPINNLANFYNSLLVAMASTERIFELLDTKPDIKDDPDAYGCLK